MERDQLEQQFTPTNNGQQSMLMATPKFGGGPAQVVPGSVQQQQMTPSQTEELKVKKAQLALSQQRLTQETATGALSPAALEFAAQLVAQGQPMPSMGMGTTAAKMRAQVLEKAAQIANGPPAGDAPPAGQAAPSGNMADAAGNVIQNRIGYRTAAATQRAFSTGVESRRTTSINALAEHLNTVDGVAEALNNGNVQAFNTIANMIAQQTGQPAPTNLKSVMAIVGPEIIKAIVPSGGGELERRNAETLINQAQSPAQVKGAIAKLKELVGGQLVSLETQYKAGTKKDDFRDTYLTPAAKSAFGTASAKIKGTPTAPSGGVDASNPLLK